MLMYAFSIFFFKQKSAFDLCISDWISDVCSSDLFGGLFSLFDAPCCDNDRGALSGKHYRNASSNSGVTACNQHNFPIQAKFHFYFFSGKHHLDISKTTTSGERHRRVVARMSSMYRYRWEVYSERAACSSNYFRKP